MADASNLEAIQAQLARQDAEALKVHALQQLLTTFVPGTLQSPVGYRVLLTRVRAVLDNELASTPVSDPVPPTPPGPAREDNDDEGASQEPATP